MGLNGMICCIPYGADHSMLAIDTRPAKSVNAIEEAKDSPNINSWFQAFAEAKLVHQKQ